MPYSMTLKDGSFLLENTPSALNKSMFYYVQSCGHFLCSSGYFTDREDYNTILLIYTLKGKGYLKYRGRDYTLQKGDVFIIDCMEHQYYATDDHDLWEFKYLHFNGCESRKYVNRIIENANSPVLNISGDSIIPINIDKIFNMVRENNASLDIKASCLIVEMLTELLLLSYNAKVDYIPSYIKKVMSIIEENYNKKLNLEDIAKYVNLDKFYLTKQFKKYSGHSLYEYLTSYRLNKAKELLKSTELTISEIAERVGFESVSHFIKVFKENEGTTPLKFRKYWT